MGCKWMAVMKLYPLSDVKGPILAAPIHLPGASQTWQYLALFAQSDQSIEDNTDKLS
jgi:hypothetical protein